MPAGLVPAASPAASAGLSPSTRLVAGSTGLWQLNGDQLTVTGPNGSQTVRITSIDQSAAYAVNPDGSVVASQRC